MWQATETQRHSNATHYPNITCNHSGPGIGPLPLTLDYGFHNGGMIGADIDETCRDAGLEGGIRSSNLRMMLTWHDTTYFPKRLEQGKCSGVTAEMQS